MISSYPTHEPFICVVKTTDSCIASGMMSWRSGASSADTHQFIDPDVHASWKWNGSTLEASNCRYGFYPLYYYADDNKCILSTSIPKLIEGGADTSINYPAMAVLLRLGFHLGEGTIFNNIFVLPPNGNLLWSENGLSVTGGFVIPAEQTYSRNDAIDNYIELFRQSMRRRSLPSGSFALPLSGGRDSRHILLELNEKESKPSFCVTTHEFPPSNREDIRIARMLCDRLGIKFVPLYQPSSRLQAEIRKNISTNFGALEHAWSVVLADYLIGKVSAVYDGIGGDVLSAGLYLIPEHQKLYNESRFEELAKLLLSGKESYRGYEDALKRITSPGVYKLINLDSAIELLSGELKRHVDAPSPLSSFYFWNRTRRCISLYNYGVMPKSVNMITPYLDCDLYDFLASLPVNLLADKKLHDQTIDRAYPNYASMPYEDKSCINTANHWQVRRFIAEVAFYVYRKSSGHLVNGSYILPRLLTYTLTSDPVIKNWLSPMATLYLTQLECMLEG